MKLSRLDAQRRRESTNGGITKSVLTVIESELSELVQLHSKKERKAALLHCRYWCSFRQKAVNEFLAFQFVSMICETQLCARDNVTAVKLLVLIHAK